MLVTQQNLESFLVEIQDKYGYDFSGYSRNSFLRRITRFMNMFQIPHLDDLTARLMANEFFFGKFVEEVTVNITEMFRDPLFYQALKESVIPVLEIHPFVRVWYAGFSTGEETYSLSIILKEEGLAEKSRIYATDINQKVLAEAAHGIFNIHDIACY